MKTLRPTVPVTWIRIARSSREVNSRIDRSGDLYVECRNIDGLDVDGTDPPITCRSMGISEMVKRVG